MYWFTKSRRLSILTRAGHPPPTRQAQPGSYIISFCAGFTESPRRVLLGNSRGVRRRLPFSDNRKLRPFWCIDPRVPVNCGHGRRSGAAAKTLVVGGGPRTGASARGSSGTRTHGADRARVGAPLGELREIRSGRGGANPKGACGEQYERLCLSGGHESGEEGGRRLEARLPSRR